MAVTLLGSISQISSYSPIAPNLFLPHRRIQTPRVRMRTRCNLQQQQQQHNDNKFKIVVVNRSHKETSLLSITEGEGIDDIIQIPGLDALPVASCHGLFLTTRRFGIWNPAKDDDGDEVIRTIPESSVPRPPNIVHETNLMYGFGFDPSSNDHKVIRFVDIQCDDDDYEDDGVVDNFYWLVELFSLKTQSWKLIAYPHGTAGHLADSAGICINGFYYWKMRACYTGRLLILPFDLANDTFPSALIPGPDGFVGFQYHLVEFEGSLAVVAYEDEPFEFELWVWNHNDKSWSKRGAWAINGGDVNFYFPVRFFFKNDQIFLQNSMRELVLFDFAKQKLKNLGFYGAHDKYLRIFPYVES